MATISNIDFGFRDLEIFSKVVELESFSKAAEAVFLAQATVSERIASLETKVGTQLLDRLGRKVTPTAAGELLYKHAALLSEMKTTAKQEMGRFLGLEEGEVTLGGSTIPGEYILPRLIGRFNQEYPGLSVNLTISDSRRIEKAVLAGRLEIGVIGYKSESPDLFCQKLWQDELVLALPAKHPWAKRKSVTLKALYTKPFILREKGSGTLEILETYLSKSKAEGLHAFDVRARLGSSTAIKEGVKAGLGLSILSKRALETEIKAGQIKALQVEGLSMTRNFFVIRNKQRIASPATETILKFLRTTTGD